jgi:Amino acid permease
MVFMFITAFVLAEICSALPLSGSIYIWAAESAGPKYARFFGFLVAWWSTTAWMTFSAGNCQVRDGPPCSSSPVLTRVGNSELHRVTACCMGGRLSWWYYKRQHQMAGIRLGCLRTDVDSLYRDQLPPAKMVQGRVPLLGVHSHA